MWGRRRRFRRHRRPRRHRYPPRPPLRTPSCDDLTNAGRTAFGHPVPDEECATDIASQEPKDVEVSDIEIDGESATAVVDSFNFRLVQVDGEWLIDGGA